MHFVLEGFVKVARHTTAGTGHDKTDERIIAYRQKGDYFAGGLDVLGDGRAVSVIAITRVNVAEVPGEAIHTLLARYPAINRRFTERLRRYRETATAVERVADPISAPGMHADLHALVGGGVIEGTEVLVIDLEKCIQCNQCEDACARRFPSGIGLRPMRGEAVAAARGMKLDMNRFSSVGAAVHRARLRRRSRIDTDLRGIRYPLGREPNADRNGIASRAGVIRAVGQDVLRLADLIRDAQERGTTERLVEGWSERSRRRDGVVAVDDARDRAVIACGRVKRDDRVANPELQGRDRQRATRFGRKLDGNHERLAGTEGDDDPVRHVGGRKGHPCAARERLTIGKRAR